LSCRRIRTGHRRPGFESKPRLSMADACLWSATDRRGARGRCRVASRDCPPRNGWSSSYRHTNVGEVMLRRPIAVTFAAHSLEPLLHCPHRNAQQAPYPDCRDFASRGGGITPVAAQSEIPPSGLGNGNRQNLVRHWSLDCRGRPNSAPGYIEANVHLHERHLCPYRILCYGLSHIVLLDHGTNGKTQENRCR
jgi:hypothetical protein